MRWRASRVLATARGHTHDLLLVQDDVGQPDGLGRHSDGGDASVVVRVPLQLHVDPFLSKCQIHNSSENDPLRLPSCPEFGAIMCNGMKDLVWKSEWQCARGKHLQTNEHIFQVFCLINKQVTVL